MTQRFFQFFLTLGLALGVVATASCGDNIPRKQLVDPSPKALAAALELKRDFPKARVFFSQNSGEILWIDGGGASLAEGLSQTPVHALAVIHGFFARYPKLFRIQDPMRSLVNDEGGLRINPSAPELATLRFKQVQDGTPIEGQHGAATFDQAGRLLGLQTRLMPDSSFEAELKSPDVNSARLTPLPNAPAGTRRAWRNIAPADPTQAPSYRYQLLDERVERNGIEVRRVLSDPRTGEVLKTYDETPSELVTAPSGWQAQTRVEVNALDSLGRTLSIPSTQAEGVLVLGFHLDGIHAAGKAVFISNAGSSSDRTQIPLQPLASSAASWVDEPAFEPELRAAATLAAHLRTTLQWFERELDWASWNGRGSSLYTAIRGHRTSDSKPELNAWGSGGAILIGDGLSPTGQPLSDALDIVGHEFTHSLIEATANFRYYGESGALNESLADFFGKAVQGFPDTIEGSQAGVYFRDLADPEGCESPAGDDCRQPGHYSGFEILADDDDSAGVHTNSGILNRALTRVALQSGNAIPLARLVLHSLLYAGFDTEARLEDFAAGLTAYCQALDHSRSLPSRPTPLCSSLEASFKETELLGHSY